MRAGVLALQGDFAEHLVALERAGAEAVEVRLPRDLAGLDAIVLPGGESTTIARMLDIFELREPLRTAILAGLPAWGTCAGAILLATEVPTLDRPTLEVLDITVLRNAYGRQAESFEEAIDLPGTSSGPTRVVFIRAPVIERAGASVEVLARTQDGRMVAVRERHILATTFHPELGEDPAWHRFFLREVAGGVVAAG